MASWITWGHQESCNVPESMTWYLLLCRMSMINVRILCHWSMLTSSNAAGLKLLPAWASPGGLVKAACGAPFRPLDSVGLELRPENVWEFSVWELVPENEHSPQVPRWLWSCCWGKCKPVPWHPSSIPPVLLWHDANGARGFSFYEAPSWCSCRLAMDVFSKTSWNVWVVKGSQGWKIITRGQSACRAGTAWGWRSRWGNRRSWKEEVRDQKL